MPEPMLSKADVLAELKVLRAGLAAGSTYERRILDNISVAVAAWCVVDGGHQYVEPIGNYSGDFWPGGKRKPEAECAPRFCQHCRATEPDGGHA